MFASGEIARAALALGDLEIVCPVCGTDCVLSSTSKDAASGHREWPIECLVRRSWAVSRAIHRTCPGGSRLTDCVRQAHALLGPIATYIAAEPDPMAFSSVFQALPPIYKTWTAISDIMYWEFYGRPVFAFVWGDPQCPDAQVVNPWRLQEMRDAAEDLGMLSLRCVNPLNAQSLWMLAVSEEEACRSGTALYTQAIAEELPWSRCVQVAAGALLDLRRAMKARYGEWGGSMPARLWVDEASCRESHDARPCEFPRYMLSIESVLDAFDAADRAYQVLVKRRPVAYRLGGVNPS